MEFFLSITIKIIIYLTIFLVIGIAIVSHELAHGVAADNLGDITPRAQGRLTINPLAHIDKFGTIILPILLYIASFGKFTLGFAKPVPINPYNFRNMFRDMAIVGAAGPLTNFSLAYIFATPLRWEFISPNGLLGFILVQSILINILLGTFNLIPIPPLDGSRILMGVLPKNYAYSFAKFERYGLIILLLLVFMGGDLLSITIFPVINFLFTLFTGLPGLI